MRKLLTCCRALALALSLAAPARADSLWEPNNSFYERHADECQYLGRSFYANGAEGYITLWDAPGGYLVKGQFSNGFILWVYYQFEDWVYAVAWGDEGEISGWAPIEDFALEYDHLSFAEEYADAIYPYCGQFADYDGDAEEIVFYEYPGAPVSKDVREAAWALDELTGQAGDSYIQSIFVDEDGRTWGYVGYLYGRINAWFCLDDPGGTDFPVREVEAPELTPAQTPRLPAMAYVPYALVAAVVVVTAVLLAVFFRKKRGR